MAEQVATEAVASPQVSPPQVFPIVVDGLVVGSVTLNRAPDKKTVNSLRALAQYLEAVAVGQATY